MNVNNLGCCEGRSALERRLRMNAEFVKSKRWGEAMAILANPLVSFPIRNKAKLDIKCILCGGTGLE